MFHPCKFRGDGYYHLQMNGLYRTLLNRAFIGRLFVKPIFLGSTPCYLGGYINSLGVGLTTSIE